jgi:large-conductance mechanosensitive channel
MANKRRKHAPVDQTKVVTTGTVVRMETPRSDRGKPHVTVSPEFIPGHGFVQFLREHAIVGLAIGFVIATQVQSLVKLLVDSFINPAFQLLFGQSLTSRSFHLTFHGRSVPFNWGSFAYGLLDFVFVLAAVYLLVRMLNLERVDKPKKTSA